MLGLWTPLVLYSGVKTVPGVSSGLPIWSPILWSEEGPNSPQSNPRVTLNRVSPLKNYSRTQPVLTLGILVRQCLLSRRVQILTSLDLTPFPTLFTSVTFTSPSTTFLSLFETFTREVTDSRSLTRRTPETSGRIGVPGRSFINNILTADFLFSYPWTGWSPYLVKVH